MITDQVTAWLIEYIIIADELIKGNFSDGSCIQIKMKNKTELSFTEIDRKEDSKEDVEVK